MHKWRKDGTSIVMKLSPGATIKVYGWTDMYKTRYYGVALVLPGFGYMEVTRKSSNYVTGSKYWYKKQEARQAAEKFLEALGVK